MGRRDNLEGWKGAFSQALNRRLQCLAEERSRKTEIWRLFCGLPEGVPGLLVDQFGSELVLWWYPDACPVERDALPGVAQWWAAQTAATSVILKVQHRNRSSHQHLAGGVKNAEVLAGSVSEGGGGRILRERGVRYSVELEGGFSVGFFLDQRTNRVALAEHIAPGSRVLNLFSYTCSFSVACALRGASTVNVDLSKRSLEWGKLNLQLNEVAVSGHEFWKFDVSEYLALAKKRGWEFDLVILDPPSFSRNRDGKVFRLETEYGKLVAQIAPVVRSGGRLFCSTNLVTWTADHLLAPLTSGAMGELWSRVPLPPPSEDYAVSELPVSSVLLRKGVQ